MAGVVRPPGVSFAPSSSPAPSAPIGAKHKKKAKHSKWSSGERTVWLKKREFFWEMSGTMRQFAALGTVSKPLCSPAAFQYRAPGTDQGDRQGDVEHASVYDARFRFVKNTFPVAIVLQSDIRGRVYGGSSRGDTYERGVVIIPGNTMLEYSGADGQFLLPNPQLNNSVVQEFCMDAGRDLIRECIPTGENDEYLVPHDSPLVRIMERNEPFIGAKYPGFRVNRNRVGTKYLINADIVHQANRFFTNEIAKKMPHISLSKLSFGLSRYDAPWLADVIPGARQDANSRLMDSHCVVSFMIEMTYSLPFN